MRAPIYSSISLIRKAAAAPSLEAAKRPGRSRRCSKSVSVNSVKSFSAALRRAEECRQADQTGPLAQRRKASHAAGLSSARAAMIRASWSAPVRMFVPVERAMTKLSAGASAKPSRNRRGLDLRNWKGRVMAATWSSRPHRRACPFEVHSCPSKGRDGGMGRSSSGGSRGGLQYQGSIQHGGGGCCQSQGS